MTDHASTQAISTDQLKAFVERIEVLEKQKSSIAVDIGDVYAEAKSNGYDKKIIRSIIKLRKKSRDGRLEEEALLDLYCQALGMN